MSVLWLRTAAALYACGLLYALLYLFTRSTKLFKPALTAFGIGAVFHLVSLVEFRIATGHLPLNDFWQTSSICAFLIAVAFLLAYGFYRVEIFSVVLFPVVFFMTLIGAAEFPVTSWSSPEARNAWLIVHITTVLVGYAALLLAAVASIYYLLQERQIKRKRINTSATRLPPLGTLDLLITQALNTGFVFITAGTATGVGWAFIESGTRWVADPKIAFFLFTWAFYLAMMILRTAAGWRGRKMAWLAVCVLACFVATWVTHLSIERVWMR